MKTDYKRVQVLAKLFEDYWIPFDIVPLDVGGTNMVVNKLTDHKSGSVYIERFDPSVNSFTVYKFDKFNVPKEWQIEEDSDVTVTV
jgi:1-acyl-sn-glycerol-3-phosphate acyltransferase